ncbi:MAG: Mur ligase family protein [Bacteroidota bacterium]
MIENYPQALQFIFSTLPMFHRVGAAAYKNNLDNTIALSALAGKPEQQFPSIHIAGTNGKGSVANMLASVLHESGFKTGLFTSPHLKDFRERIRINGKMIPKTTVKKFIQKYENDFEQIQPSFFEMTFALAMQYFAQHKVDIAVIESGMGGRLDSTNILRPVLSIITNISFDHTQFLGDTLEKIAIEKAGIIKSGVPVLIGKTQNETREVFENSAKKVNSEIHFVDSTYQVRNLVHSNVPPFGSTFNLFKNDVQEFSDVYTTLSGDYQKENFQTVFAACDILNDCGYIINKSGVIKGLENLVKNTDFKGRWQVKAQFPLIVFDTAHNEAGIRQVIEQILKLKVGKLHIVLGMVRDKDYTELLALLPKEAEYYFCKPNIPRGLNEEILLEKALGLGLKGNSYASVKVAYQQAQKMANAADMIYVGGSTFVVAELV